MLLLTRIATVLDFCVTLVAMSNLNEDRLLEKLIQLNKHNLLNIPVAEVGDVLHVELGLVLKKIIKVVRRTLQLFLYRVSTAKTKPGRHPVSRPPRCTQT